MADWSRISTQPDDDQGRQGLFDRRGSIRKPPNMSVTKEETRIVKMEFMDIKDSDTETPSVERLLQNSRCPRDCQQKKGDQSQLKKHLLNFGIIMEENRNSDLKTPEDLRPAENKMTVYQTTDNPPRGEQFSFRRRAISMQTKATTSEFPSKPRKFQRSNSTASRKRSLESVRIVLIGKTGVGKSATGNTILGCDVFQSKARMKSVTKTCQEESGEACGRPVTVVDTPGLFDTSLSNEDAQQEIRRCIELSAPGPHVFLLVIAVGPFTQEERETLQLIKMTFGEKADAFTMVLFTRGDNLTDESIEDYIKDGDPHVQQLIDDCGGRFHVFNNKQKDPAQVVGLLKKIDKMMWNNGSSFYNDKMFQEAERAIRLKQINREREDEVRLEIEAIKAKYESELKEMKDKLEEQKLKAKVSELLLMATENKLLRNHQTGRNRDNEAKADIEQTQDELGSKAPFEKNNEEKEISGKTDTEQGATEGESDRDEKKQTKKLSRFGPFVGRKREKNQRRMEECEEMKPEIQEQHREEIKHPVKEPKIKKDTGKFRKEKTSMKPVDQTDTRKNPEDERDVNKNKLLYDQYKDIEDCKQKMEEIKRRYKEIKEIQAAEYKKMKDNVERGNCVVQ